MDDATVTSESDQRGYIIVAPRGLGSGAPDNKNNSWTFKGSASGVIVNGSEQTPVCDVTVTPDYRYPSCKKRLAKNSCSWTQCQDDDVAFVQDLVRHLETQLCIDGHHVFASGGSNGGMLTWELGVNTRTARMFRAIAPIIGLPHRGDLRSPGKRGGLPVLLITGTADTAVPPGDWDNARFTTTSNDRDRFYYTGSTAIIRRWSKAAGCSIKRREQPINIGNAPLQCRSYCASSNRAGPTVLDCRASMGHDYDLAQTWPLILKFFDGF